MQAYDIIIQGGQSNAEGCGLGPVDQEYIPNANILYLDVEKIVDPRPDGVCVTYEDKPFVLHTAKERLCGDNVLGDFSLTFSNSYVKNGFLKNGRKVLIVRAAIGGTAFKKEHWGLKDSLYLKMLEMIDYALSLNPENKIVAFLWHQGETDALEGNPAENYKKQLFSMVNGVREKFGNMPFIAGDFSNEWKSKNQSICNPIIDAIKKVAEQVGNAEFIETADLLSNNQKTGNGDDIHFCRDSLHKLGERYFSKYLSLIK